jgi:hypothetical protein
MNSTRFTRHGLAIGCILAGTAGFSSLALGDNGGFVLDTHDSHAERGNEQIRSRQLFGTYQGTWSRRL